MTDALKQAQRLLGTLTRDEKAMLLSWVVHDLEGVSPGVVENVFPGIANVPGVCGGEACIVRTRIPVWVLAQARRLGTGDAELLDAYPTLRADDLANAWAYVEVHREEVESQILANENA
jgi:uncharacterized protein (DUF433 family)